MPNKEPRRLVVVGRWGPGERATIVDVAHPAQAAVLGLPVWNPKARS